MDPTTAATHSTDAQKYNEVLRILKNASYIFVSSGSLLVPLLLLSSEPATVGFEHE